MNQTDPNFDWVTARAKCSPSEVFARLESQVEDDIRKRNEVLTESEQRQGVKFHFQRDRNQFSVWTLHDKERVGYAAFQIIADGIKVIYLDPLPSLVGTLTLSNDGECRLKVNGDEYAFWQFRKLALEPILFTVVANFR